MRLVLGWFAVCLAVMGLGCMWDRDTVAAELKGMPELQDVIAGRFERNPDLYYEMRLTRFEKMDRNPFLEEYFDLAVACDRLGRHDDAIEWIERFDREAAKEKVTDAEWRDLSYKRTANLGTFYIHRGIGKGEQGLEDLKKGLDLIEKAIEINPEAHFGREKVQAALVRQIIWQTEVDAKVKKLRDAGKENEADELAYLEEPPATGLKLGEIREGVIGLMVLGNAWEAPVAWEWLMGTYGLEDSHVAEMINARIQEIEPGRDIAYDGLPDPLQVPMYMPADEKRTQEIYLGLRTNGIEWAKNREEFMVSKLKAGMRPDTDKDFWDGYVETPRYEIIETVPGGSLDPMDQLVFLAKALGGACITVLTGLGVGIFWLRRVIVGRAENSKPAR